MKSPRNNHPKTINKYQGTIAELAADIANLDYDSLAHFILYLGMNIKNDSVKDSAGGRIELSDHLNNASKFILEAHADFELAADICRPFNRIDAINNAT